MYCFRRVRRFEGFTFIRQTSWMDFSSSMKRGMEFVG